MQFVQIVNGIADVQIEGPGANLLDPDGMRVLSAKLRAADEDEAVTGIRLIGSAEAFCGGLDLGSVSSPQDSVALASELVGLLRVFPQLTKPIAASVVGDALASGASLVSAVDYAAAAPTARVGTVEVGKGIWPMVAQVPLIHRLGARVAMENLGSGVPFTATRAVEVGLVNVVSEDPDRAAAEWLTAAGRGGRAARTGRPFAYALEQMTYDDALASALTKFSSMFEAR